MGASLRQVADNKVHNYDIGVSSISDQTPEDPFILHSQLQTAPFLQSDHHLLHIPQILADIVSRLHLDGSMIATNHT